jgi:signal transduction histidine kinase
LIYYFLDVVKIENITLFAIILLSIILLSAVFIAKLAVDPLIEYVHQLQALSKETLHELNLPISTITTNTQMLRNNISEAKNLKRVARIESACDMLKERYNELDYLIKMQSEQSVVERFFIDDLVRERVGFLEKIYPHMVFDLQLCAMEWQGDKKGLAKVIDNLIDNAVKYSDNSKKIDIRLENATLTIQDYGIGMDEVEIIHIFDKYYQTNSDMQGFGIGLNLVKRFCDKEGIDLGFDSKKGVGTRVKLQFKQDR